MLSRCTEEKTQGVSWRECGVCVCEGGRLRVKKWMLSVGVEWVEGLRWRECGVGG